MIIREGAISSLRDEFERTGIAMMPGFLSEPVLRSLLANLESASYYERDEISAKERVFGTTLFVPPDDPIIGAFLFVLNRPELFRAVTAITGCPAPRNFFGRLHQTSAGTGHQIDWHEDTIGARVLGLDINLSRYPVEGGSFQLRDSNRVFRREICDWAAGDAFLFRIAQGWQHRLTPVTAGSRTVGVGWFRTEPDWNEIVSSVRSSRPDWSFA